MVEKGQSFESVIRGHIRLTAWQAKRLLLEAAGLDAGTHRTESNDTNEIIKMATNATSAVVTAAIRRIKRSR
jgi:hypothetical protein